MNKREKIIGTIMLVSVLGYVGIQYLNLGSVFGGGLSSEVEMAEEDYQQTVEQVGGASQVFREFRQLVGENNQIEEENREGYLPDIELQKDIGRWCQMVGFPRPRFEYKVEDIRGPDNELVWDYQLVVMTISLPEGDLDRFSKLLKLFESNGLIIQYVNLTSRGRDGKLAAEITVARLVKAFKETRERFNARSR